MFPSPAGAAPASHGARVELPVEIRGRPGAVLAWFAPADREAGILRPQFVTAMAVDVDGCVYETLTKPELEAVMPQLRERAERLLEE